jgi:hypothetical protein
MSGTATPLDNQAHRRVRDRDGHRPSPTRLKMPRRWDGRGQNSCDPSPDRRRSRRLAPALIGAAPRHVRAKARPQSARTHRSEVFWRKQSRQPNALPATPCSPRKRSRGLVLKSLDGSECVLDRLPSHSHHLGLTIQPQLHRLENCFAFPARDTPIIAWRAARFERTLHAPWIRLNAPNSASAGSSIHR